MLGLMLQEWFKAIKTNAVKYKKNKNGLFISFASVFFLTRIKSLRPKVPDAGISMTYDIPGRCQVT